MEQELSLPQPQEVVAQELKQQKVYISKVKELLGQRYLRQPLAYVHTYGCQGNVADGEKLKGFLRDMGYGFASCKEEADLVLYNTCAVRENAEKKLFGKIGELKALKEQKPELLIALCGCMMQEETVTEKIQKSYRQVDLILGTHVMHLFPQLLHQALCSKGLVVEAANRENVIAEGLPLQRESAFQASVQIMYGCNNFCSYCIVPYVRGREVSRQPQHILQEVTQLVQQGYKEILLLGQNVNSYGKGLEENITFAQLLRQIDAIPGDFWVRFMTSHPKDCTKELIDTIAQCPKVCRQVHLPVQSGNDRILKQMNRQYTRQQYLELIDYAKSTIPDVSFSSDIIVGFPGETYEEFLDTLSLVQQVGYQNLYTFIYSKRNGTKAAQMEDPVPGKEKARWVNQLIQAEYAVSDKLNLAYEGKTIRVLAENESSEQDGCLMGHNSQGVLVKFPAPKELLGQFVNITVTQGRRAVLYGEPVAPKTV